MIKHSLLHLIWLFVCLVDGKAQFDVSLGQYWELRGLYNPAWVGQTDKINVVGAYGMYLPGFSKTPRSMYLGTGVPLSFLDRRWGIGAGFFREETGHYRNNHTWVQYAYRTKLRRGRLSMGLQLGALNVSFNPDGTNLGNTEIGEDIPKSKKSDTSVDAGLGIFYSHSKFYLGASGQHLTAPRISLDEKNETEVSPTVYLTGGYNIQTHHPLFSIQPSFLFRSDFTSARLDITGRLFYLLNEKVFNGGVGYSPDNSVTFCLGATIRNFTVGYAYELFTSKVGTTNGAHDLLVTYSTSINVSKKNKNKHKSIRIL